MMDIQGLIDAGLKIVEGVLGVLRWFGIL